MLNSLKSSKKMNKQSNTYIITYASILVVAVAAVLSYTAITLRPTQQQNIEIEMMSSILGSVGELGEAKDPAAIEAAYNNVVIESFLINPSGERKEASKEELFAKLSSLKDAYAASEESRELPIFITKNSKGQINYVIPIIGTGLWGSIWGYIAVNSDGNTIDGVVFDHKSETPGLGAEIATPDFEGQYVNKKLFNGDTFVGVGVTKGAGSSTGNDHAVDAISGGTITSRAVGDMVVSCVNDYVPFLKKASSVE